MNVKLVYLIDGVEIELESNMDLEELDQFTYKNFNNEEDVIKSEKYKDKIGHFPKNGRVMVAFDRLEVPIKTLDYITDFGFDPFKEGHYYMTSLTSDRNIAPTKRSFREEIAKTITSSFEVVEEFFQKYKDKFTLEECILYYEGMIYEDNKLMFGGIRRIVDEAFNNKNGYFVGRMFVDSFGDYSSVQNKDERGRICSSKVFKKNDCK